MKALTGACSRASLSGEDGSKKVPNVLSKKIIYSKLQLCHFSTASLSGCPTKDFGER
jgi:hypothetical protein